MASRLSSKLFVSTQFLALEVCYRNPRLTFCFVCGLGLSSFTTKEKLWQMFSPFGDITEARLVIDPNTKRPKGFGFVTYNSEVEAHKAIKVMDGRMVDGRLIFVVVANPDERLPEESSSR